MATDVPRAERAKEAAGLRAQGLLQREIAERMGISRSYASELVADPEGLKVAARKKSYRGVCVDCGGPTDGGNGRAKAPVRCIPCHLKHVEAPHGTRSRYNRCSCDACRAANTEFQRKRNKERRGKPPPSHGLSGYINFGCRCAICTRANTAASWGYKRRHLAKKRTAA